MKKPSFKFFILRRLAHLLRSWANLASKLSGMEDNSENVDFSVSHASFSVVTEGLSMPVKDGESTGTAGPPAHWLARIEATRQPAHWLSHVSANRPATQKSQERQNLQEPQSQKEYQESRTSPQLVPVAPSDNKEYINQENRTLSRSIPIIPPDDRERTTSHSVQVADNTPTEEDVNRQATSGSENSAVKYITMKRPAPLIESDIRQIWGQRAVFAPLSQSSTPAPREWPGSSTTSDPSPWQEKVALPVMPKVEQIITSQDKEAISSVILKNDRIAELPDQRLIQPFTPQVEQNLILQDRRDAEASAYRLQNQMSEPMQPVLPRPFETTANRTFANGSQIVEQSHDRESVSLQDLTMLDDNVHRWSQKRMPEQVGQLDQPPLPPVASLISQVVKMDSPSQEARFDRHTTLAGEPMLWAQIRPAEPMSLPQSGNQASIPTQVTMHWPSLPEDSTLNMTSDSQDLTLMRRSWERQQRLNEEQRGNLWNA